jgi:hypothetical protein
VTTGRAADPARLPAPADAPVVTASCRLSVLAGGPAVGAQRGDAGALNNVLRAAVRAESGDVSSALTRSASAYFPMVTPRITIGSVLGACGLP